MTIKEAIQEFKTVTETPVKQEEVEGLIEYLESQQQ